MSDQIRQWICRILRSARDPAARPAASIERAEQRHVDHRGRGGQDQPSSVESVADLELRGLAIGQPLQADRRVSYAKTALS
jgi:hypothetical protein